MKNKTHLKYRVRLGRFSSAVEFRLLAQSQTFALCPDDMATVFDNPVTAEDAIQQCPAIQSFGPYIEPFIPNAEILKS